jgi:hypothetical protein
MPDLAPARRRDRQLWALDRAVVKPCRTGPRNRCASASRPKRPGCCGMLLGVTNDRVMSGRAGLRRSASAACSAALGSSRDGYSNSTGV